MKPYTFDDLITIMATLRGPNGCPWDKEQTPTSILPHLIEEAYETVDAIETGPAKAKIEELGDLLLQVVFHAQFLTEQSEGSMATIIQALCDKLVRRHPHVFGDATAQNTDEVLRNWEAIKAEEKKNTKQSMLSGIPQSLPGLLRAHRLGEKTARVGFDWESTDGVIDKVAEEVRELKEALTQHNQEAISDEFGDLLFTLASVGRKLHLDPETSLRRACHRFETRFAKMEEMIRADGREIHTVSAEEWDRYWNKAKQQS